MLGTHGPSLSMAPPPPPLPAARRPLRVDVHTHALPKDLPNFKQKFGYGGFIQMDHSCSCGPPRAPNKAPGATAVANMMNDNGSFFRQVENDLWDIEPRLLYMDGVGVQDPELAIQELRRCMLELNFAGIQIGSHVDAYDGEGRPPWHVNLSDPSLLPIFREAERLRAAIFVHPWDMMGEAHMKRYWLPWLVGMPAETSLAICSVIFSGLLETCPKLRMLFAHGGGSFPATVGRIQHGFDCRPDLCAIDNPVSPSEYLGRIWVDSVVHDLVAFRLIMEVMGKDRICLGTDYPFPLGECYPLKTPGDLIVSCSPKDASNIEKGNMLGLNAFEWLGVSPAPYMASARAKDAEYLGDATPSTAARWTPPSSVASSPTSVASDVLDQDQDQM